MIHLLGIDHSIQVDVHEKYLETKKYKNFLKLNIIKYKINLVAEEFSKEILSFPYNANLISTTTKTVTDDLGIKHRYCDPSPTKRIKMSINNDLKREQYWMIKIKDLINDHIIFVCGKDHLKTFSYLLKKNNFTVKVFADTFLTL